MKTQEKVKNAIKWIDRLASTRVKQGKGCLGDSTIGYCCLGYGCKVLKIPYNYDSDTSPKFKEAVGLLEEAGAFNIRLSSLSFSEASYVSSLAELNDDGGYSFREISTFIKGNLIELFEPAVAKLLTKHYKQNK